MVTHCQHHLATLCQKEGISASEVIFLCAKRLNGLVSFESSRGTVFCGFTEAGVWWQRNGIVFTNMQWPIEKTRKVIWNALHDCGKTECKWTLRDLEKTLDVAYRDILNKSYLTWGSKALP